MSLCIRDFKAEDAAGIARLFNESEEGWPGGLTGGVPYTAERVLDEFRRTNTIAHLVAELDGRIVGYLRLDRHWLGPDATYIALLNVHPEYRGRGIGTRLLKEAIRRSIDLGVDRVDLHTWPGNARAIRLYKKLGFFWVPGTGVYMQNYLPAILKMPLARAYFARHPEALYSFKRDLSIEEDDFKVRGRRTYVYSWEIENDPLKVYVDAYAWGITGVEWREGVVECYTDEPPIGRGLPFRVYWRIKNLSSSPLRAVIMPTLDTGLTLKSGIPSVLRVPPGGEEYASAVLLVDPNARPKPRGEPSRRIRSTVLLGDLSLSLTTGFEEVSPLTASLIHPRAVPPGCRGELLLNVENMLRKKAKFVITLVAGEGVSARPVNKTLTLGPREGALLPLEVEVGREVEAGELSLYYRVDVDGASHSGRPLRISFTCPSPDRVSWYHDPEREELVLDRGDVVLHVELRGGRVTVRDRDGEVIAQLSGESVGPPFWPNMLSRELFEYAVSREGRGVKMRLSAPVRDVPGLKLIKEFELMPGNPVVKATYWLENSSDGKRTGKLRISSWASPWRAEKLVAPTAGGLLEAQVVPLEFPGRRGDMPVSPSSYSEGWACYALREGLVCGVAWEAERLEEIDFSGCMLPTLTYGFSVPPCSRVKVARLAFYVGGGAWRDVRRVYWLLIRREVEPPPPHCRLGVVEVSAHLRPPLLKAGRQSRLELVLRKRRGKRLKGVLKLWGEGVDVEPVKMEVELEKDLAKWEVRVTPKSVGASAVRYVLDTSYGRLRGEVPIIALGKGAVLVREEQGSWILENGIMRIRAAPSFAGSVYSVEVEGVEQLFSSYPRPSQLVWINPWYGGIRLVSGLGRDKLCKERWMAEEACVGGWRGLRMYTRVSSEENVRLRGLAISQYYLLRPGGKFIALHTVLENRSGKALEPELYLTVFTKPGGHEAQGLAVRREEGVSEAKIWEYETPYLVSERQAVVYSEAGAVTLIAPPVGLEVLAMSFGRGYSSHLALVISPERPLKPGEAYEVTSYLAFAHSLEEALRYAALSEMQLTLRGCK
ncbi:MAG: hypothetical protein DRK00_00480 [Thermoprotei archaeon]|nr:MAG: hypothetical protein DRK00_00480 [Thermoprotei archaeon]